MHTSFSSLPVPHQTFSLVESADDASGAGRPPVFSSEELMRMQWSVRHLGYRLDTYFTTRRAPVADHRAAVTHICLPRWGTLVAFWGSLGQRLRRAYIQESLHLTAY